MAGTAIETIPTTWDETSASFFRITASLFDAGFCLGASVLLSSYDDECPQPVGVTTAEPVAAAEYAEAVSR